MTQKYKIETITDILKLTPSQRSNCVVDLLAWCDFMDVVKDEKLPLTDMGFFIWVDDDRIGEVSGVSIHTRERKLDD
jgi:hypothetical protein